MSEARRMRSALGAGYWRKGRKLRREIAGK